jgi:hypothetical protein
MAVNLNITSGLEARLEARAQALGLSVESFIETVLEREAATSCTNGCSSMTGAEKAKAFRAWANSFPPDLPVLSLEDVSRESVYRRD